MGDNPCVCLVPNCLPVLVWSCFSSGNCWLQQQTDPQHGSLKRMWDFFFSGEVSGRRKGLSPVQCSKSGLCSVSIPLSLRPPPRVDNHNSRLSFLHSSLFVSSYSSGQEESFMTQPARPPKQQSWGQNFARNSFCRSFLLPRKRDRRRACVIAGDTLRSERETESCVKAHRRRKKPDLLSPKRKKLTADVCSQILPLPPIMETHAKICSASRVFFPMHTFTNTRINFSPRFTYLYVPTRRHTHALRR